MSPAEGRAYYLLYKPPGCVTTASDPEGRPTALDYLRGVKERVFPVGRLDFDAEGALLFTDDGELANRLAHPRYGHRRIYLVKVKGDPAAEALQRMTAGVRLEDGPAQRARGDRPRARREERLDPDGRRRGALPPREAALRGGRAPGPAALPPRVRRHHGGRAPRRQVPCARSDGGPRPAPDGRARGRRGRATAPAAPQRAAEGGAASRPRAAPGARLASRGSDGSTTSPRSSSSGEPARSARSSERPADRRARDWDRRRRVPRSGQRAARPAGSGCGRRVRSGSAADRSIRARGAAPPAPPRGRGEPAGRPRVLARRSSGRPSVPGGGTCRSRRAGRAGRSR